MKRLLTPVFLGIAFEGLLIGLLCFFPVGGKPADSPVGFAIALIHWPMVELVSLLSPTSLTSSPVTALPYLAFVLQALLWSIVFFALGSYFRRSPKKA